jgi:cytochrome c
MAKHSLEFNKVAAGVLLAGVIAMVCGFVADGLYQDKDAEKRGYAIEVAEVATGGTAQAKVEVDIGTLMASADAAKGDAVVHKKCASCHTFEQGGPNKVGPNLYGTVGAKLGHIPGYTYSEALKAKGGTWGYEELNQWLKSPSGFIKGNKMAYAGVKNDAERADIIAYLKSISPSAPALPAPKPAEPAAPAAAPAKAAH